MQYSTLGHTGLIVSRLSLGTMTFGGEGAFPIYAGGMSQAVADQLVGNALDAGINLFDSADAYGNGQSETMLGLALGARRRDVIISTKVGGRVGRTLLDVGLSYRHIMMAVEESLKRLNTDWIDLYQLHIPDALTPRDEMLRVLEDLVRQGKIRYVGFSNLPAWSVALAIGEQKVRGFTPFCAAQMYYSLLGRDLEYECIPLYKEVGIGVLAWSSLASGFLTGKYSRNNPLPDDARRSRFDFPPIDVEKGYAVVDLLTAIAKDLDASPAQVALGWVLSRPFVSSVILGATTATQLNDTMKAADLILGKDEVEKLDALTTPAPRYPNWFADMSVDQDVRKALSC